MNGKRAKALRKALKFKVDGQREYQVTKWSTEGRTYKAIGERTKYQDAKKEYLNDKS